MIESATFVRDLIFFIKNDLSTNITDPIAGTRSAGSSWVMTSYPQKKVEYPILTIKANNFEARRAGMGTDQMDMQITLEIRIWARNQKEKDQLYQSVFNRLRQIQITTNGSVDSDIHDFAQTSAINVDEDGDGAPKSRVIEVTYKFYSFS